MARSHARIKTTIWDDENFIARSGEAQRVYFLLLSQPGLSFCGVIPYTGRRWARLAKGTTTKGIAKAVEELADADFLVIDDEYEEVWVRSFVRHDGILIGGPKLLVAMWRDFKAIASPMLRRRFLDSLPVEIREGAPDGVSDGVSDTPSEGVSHDPSDTDPTDVGIPHPMPRGRAQPLPLVPTPAPSPGSTEAAPKGASKRATAAPPEFSLDDDLRTWAGEHVPSICDERRLLAETERWLDHHRAKGTTFKDWRAAWRTWMGRVVEYGPRPMPAPANGAPRVTAGEQAIDRVFAQLPRGAA